LKKILFFGELPPYSIHGASISNQINIDLLKKHFIVEVVEEKSAIKYHNKFSFKKLFSFVISLIFLLFKSFRKKYDFFYSVIYLSTFGILKNIFTLFVVKLFNRNTKVYLHFHRSDFDVFFNKKINDRLFHILDCFVDNYIVLSEGQQKKLVQINPNKQKVLYNTIEFEYDLTSFNLQVNKKKINVTYIGNFIKEKGIFELVEAFIKINISYPDIFTLNMYGNFSTDETKTLLLSATRDHKYININSAITGIDKFQKIANSDILILPSYNEGMPLILLECISLGKPIIISNVGFINEVLTNNYQYYCNPKDVNSIIENLIKFYSNSVIENFRIDTRMYYAKFSRSEHEKTLLNIFDENINNYGCL
jgi:glycosyltransferase involved in cell wall biosynthesis